MPGPEGVAAPAAWAGEVAPGAVPTAGAVVCAGVVVLGAVCARAGCAAIRLAIPPPRTVPSSAQRRGLVKLVILRNLPKCRPQKRRCGRTDSNANRLAVRYR